MLMLVPCENEEHKPRLAYSNKYNRIELSYAFKSLITQTDFSYNAISKLENNFKMILMQICTLHWFICNFLNFVKLVYFIYTNTIFKNELFLTRVCIDIEQF